LRKAKELNNDSSSLETMQSWYSFTN